MSFSREIFFNDQLNLENQILVAESIMTLEILRIVQLLLGI